MGPHLFQTTIRLLIPLNLYLWTSFCRPRIIRSNTVATQETVNFNVENFARQPVTSKHSKLNLPMIRKFAAFLFIHSKQKVCPCMHLVTKLRGNSSQWEPLLLNSSKFIGNVPLYQTGMVFKIIEIRFFDLFCFFCVCRRGQVLVTFFGKQFNPPIRGDEKSVYPGRTFYVGLNYPHTLLSPI